MAKTTKFLLRLPRELHADLQAKADLQGRSLNSVLVGALEGWNKIFDPADKVDISGPLNVKVPEGFTVKSSGEVIPLDWRDGAGRHCKEHNELMYQVGDKWVCDGPPLHVVI